MIELAPGHKFGLALENPVILAGGTVGYGECVPAGAQLSSLGAVVIGPFMRNGRAGNEPPRLAETNGGFVLNTGLQNRGVKAVRRHFARLWPELGCPAIAQVADSMPRMLGRVAEQLAEAEGLSALELLIPSHATLDIVRELVRQATLHCDLPILVKLPLGGGAAMAPTAVDAGAAALVIGQPPIGSGYSKSGNGGQVMLSGNLHGPLAFATMSNAFETVRSLELACPLIACGGIHTITQARQILAAGASAIQIDSAFWVEPSLPARLAKELAMDRSR